MRTLSLAEDQGGAGADQLTCAIVIEELAAGDADIAAMFAETSQLAKILFGSAMTPAQRDRLEPAAYLGHGWTAYAALTRGTHVNRGDTVFVSSGAGAIGSMAGQIARRLGAGRVIGSTSTPE